MPKKKKNKFHRSYPLECLLNSGKAQQVFPVIKEYRTTAQEIASQQWHLFYTIGDFNKNDEPLLLSFNGSFVDYQRYKQTIQYQVVGQLRSFLSNRANDFARLVSKSTLDLETRKKLYLINRHQSWYDPTLTSDLGKLARRIFRHILAQHRKPSFNKINMVLDAKVAQILPKDPTKAQSFDYWIRFSTLTLNHPIYLPLKTNSYYEEALGKQNQCLQVNQDSQGNLEFRLVKERESAKTREGNKLLGFDLGLRTLLATDCGDLLGRRFIDKLRFYDSQLLTLTRELQKHRQPLSSNLRFQRLQSRFKQFIKNETHRCLNRLVKLRNPDKIILESLDFRNTNLSKTMNRFLRRFGQTEIKRKLESLTQELGIQVIYVNPAYTSQECDLCGYIDPKNRKDEDFRCLICLNTVHADVKGARTIVSRSSWDEPLYLRKDQILQKLVNKFLERSTLSVENVAVLEANPYFNRRLPSAKDALRQHPDWQTTPSSRLLTKQLSSKGFS